MVKAKLRGSRAIESNSCFRYIGIAARKLWVSSLRVFVFGFRASGLTASMSRDWNM